MKRVTQLLVLSMFFLLLIPATGAAADECPAISGKAFFDFGRTGTGMANVVYDGQRLNVPFSAVGFDEERMEISFQWDFPQGQVLVVEKADNFTPIGGPLGRFATSLTVHDGGTGMWTWSGIANRAGGLAVIQSLQGTLCISD